jgi:hypothetical protein
MPCPDVALQAVEHPDVVEGATGSVELDTLRESGTKRPNSTPSPLLSALALTGLYYHPHPFYTPLPTTGVANGVPYISSLYPSGICKAPLWPDCGSDFGSTPLCSHFRDFFWGAYTYAQTLPILFFLFFPCCRSPAGNVSLP